MIRTWTRICQECGHEQKAKPQVGEPSDGYRHAKCKRCKSMALDYGSWKTKTDSDEDWSK